MPRGGRRSRDLRVGLSVLDFSQRFEEAAELGPYVESLGYRRYWFAEHPPQPSAEIFVALLLAMTGSLRIGTGGVVLRLRNVLQSACNLRFLHWAFSGRVDMGFCKGGSSPEIEAALSAPHATPVGNAEFDERVDQWIALLRREPSEIPAEIWSLGTGLHSARRAAALGTFYAYSLFHKHSVDDSSALELYRAQFQPQSGNRSARTMLAFSGLCAKTDAEADRQTQQFVSAEVRPIIWGATSTCVDRLMSLMERYRPDELMLYDLSPSIEDKKASYQRWADVVASLSP